MEILHTEFIDHHIKKLQRRLQKDHLHDMENSENFACNLPRIKDRLYVSTGLLGWIWNDVKISYFCPKIRKNRTCVNWRPCNLTVEYMNCVHHFEECNNFELGTDLSHFLFQIDFQSFLSITDALLFEMTSKCNNFFIKQKHKDLKLCKLFFNLKIKFLY